MELEFGPKKYTSSTSTKEPAILKNAWNLQGQKDPVGTEVGRSYYRQKKYGKAWDPKRSAILEMNLPRDP